MAPLVLKNIITQTFALEKTLVMFYCSMIKEIIFLYLQVIRN